jgi:hypothetical protein
VEGMLEILDSMTADEILEIRKNEPSPESLWPKLQELEELSSDHCNYPGLEAVLGRLDPDGHWDEEEWDEEEHEEAYEDEVNARRFPSWQGFESLKLEIVNGLNNWFIDLV